MRVCFHAKYTKHKGLHESAQGNIINRLLFFLRNFLQSSKLWFPHSSAGAPRTSNKSQDLGDLFRQKYAAGSALITTNVKEDNEEENIDVF